MQSGLAALGTSKLGYVTTPDPLIEQIVAAYKAHLIAPARNKFVSTVARSMRVRQDSEAKLYLPNGQVVKVSTDASRIATHIDDGEHMHAIVRPDTYNPRVRMKK